MNNRCYANVNLDIIKENFSSIKNYTNKKIIGVVKADAYGHGMIEVSGCLIENGVDMLAVATKDEAITLRDTFRDVEILVLGPVIGDDLQSCIENNITLMCGDFATGQAIDNISIKLNKTAKIHFAVDTGMGRVGYFLASSYEECVKEIKKIKELTNVDVSGIFTHFATADESDLTFMNKQYHDFIQLVELCKSNDLNFDYIHCQNSAAIITLKDSVCNAVRPGLILYGYYPSSFVPNVLDIKPALSWYTSITHIKDVAANTPIGYGSVYVTDKPTKIATISIGYADGLRRQLYKNGMVELRNSLCPFVGKVCMDQSMLDVSHIPNVSVGDTVSVLSTTLDADYQASKCETISYEILCGISKRVPRFYNTIKKAD